MTMYSKPTANIILTCENLKGSPLRLGIIKGCPFSPLFNIVLEVLAMAERKKKERKKRNPDWKRCNKNLTVTDDMILYIENPKDIIRKLLDLISEFSKVARYKMKKQKSLEFLYTNNEKS